MNAAADGPERLCPLCDELRAAGDPSVAAPIMFRLIERLDEADLGSPGPLVHTLEGWVGAYEAPLADSIKRKPAPLSVWMVNRILNTNPVDSAGWFDLLRSAANHPAASEATKADARSFLEHQAGG